MEEPDVIRVRTQGAESTNYLTVTGVLGLYAQIMGCNREEALDQVRNPGGLESAVLRAQNAAHYEEDADIPLQAAYLAHGIAEGQFFIDGNKRTAVIAMETFLEMNGYWLTVSDDELADWVLELSQGLSVYDLANHIHGHCESWINLRDAD